MEVTATRLQPHSSLKSHERTMLTVVGESFWPALASCTSNVSHKLLHLCSNDIRHLSNGNVHRKRRFGYVDTLNLLWKLHWLRHLARVQSFLHSKSWSGGVTFASLVWLNLANAVCRQNLWAIITSAEASMVVRSSSYYEPFLWKSYASNGVTAPCICHANQGPSSGSCLVPTSALRW